MHDLDHEVRWQRELLLHVPVGVDHRVRQVALGADCCQVARQLSSRDLPTSCAHRSSVTRTFAPPVQIRRARLRLRARPRRRDEGDRRCSCRRARACLLARASNAEPLSRIASHGDRRSGALVEHRDQHRRREPAARAGLYELVVQPRGERVERRVGRQQLVGGATAPTRRRRETPLRAEPDAWDSAGRACRSRLRRDERSPRATRLGRARRTATAPRPSRPVGVGGAWSARWCRGAASDDTESSWVALVVIRETPLHTGGCLHIVAEAASVSAPAHCTAPGDERRSSRGGGTDEVRKTTSEVPVS